MRKILMLMVALALVSGVASASTLFIVCDNPAAISIEGTSTFAATSLMCPDFGTLPAGDHLVSVTLNLEDSFDEGNTNAASNSFTFTYSAIDPDVDLLNGSLPNTCITSGVGASTTCVDTITGSGGTLIALGEFYQLGNVITSNLAAYIGGGTFQVGMVAGAPGASGGSVLGTGDIAATAFVTYTYLPNAVGSPEPMTMMLVGGGLLGLGLLVSKRRKKA